MTRVKVNTITAMGNLARNGGNIAVCKAPNETLWTLYSNTDTQPNIDWYVAYSSNGGATWTEEVALVDARINTPQGKNLALMVDSNNVPHIIFIGLNAANAYAGRIRYLSRVGGSWGSVETIASADANTNIMNLSACIDSANTFHLLATGTFSGGGSRLYYWTGTTGSWSAAQLIDSAGDTGDITVTSANLPICTYTDAGGFKFNTRNGGTWANEETISTTTENYPGNRLVVDSANDIHAVWNEKFGTGNWVGIKYRKRTSGVWGTEQIVVSGATNNVADYGHPLIGADSSNSIYVVYQYAENASPQSETVWYKPIVSQVVGTEIILDSLATQPNTFPSQYAYLWHRFPSSGILSPGNSPCCLLLNETGTDADVYILVRTAGNELTNLISIGFTTFHYVGGDGYEYVVQGTKV